MIKVGVMGYGVVGSGFIEIFDRNKEAKKLPEDIIINSILDRAKDKFVGRSYYDIIKTDAEEFFAEKNDIVVEVLGGLTPSYEFVKRALKAGSHVITANKDLIAEHGFELFQIAQENNVQLKFEAAVGGGIPIIKPLTETLYGDEIFNIKGILNGTTNFILTKMKNEGVSYKSALEEAQKLGFAEANPDSDVLGYDAARKLAILSSLSYKEKIDWKQIKTIGITEVTIDDLYFAKEVNHAIKLIGASNNINGEVYATVKPTLVEEGSIFSAINNEVNGIMVEGKEVTEATFIGKGAGSLPTGNSIYADFLDIINGYKQNTQLFQGNLKATTSIYSGVCHSLVVLEEVNKEEAVKAFGDKFKDIKVLSKDSDALGIYIQNTNQAEVETFTNELAYKCRKYYNI